MYKQLKIIDKITKNNLAFLDVLDASITRTINGQYTLQFTTFEQELKTEYLKGNSIVVDNNTFDVRYIEKSHAEGGKILYKCEAYHVFYRLRDTIYHLGYTKYGTIRQILNDLVLNTPFSIGQVDFNDTITFSIKEEVSLASLILNLANSFNGEIDYSNNGFTLNLKNSIGSNNGFTIELGKNLKGLTEIYDTREGEEKTSYSVDLIELKNSTQYEQNGFSDLEVIEIGDTVVIKDVEMNINTQQRIVSKTYNPILAKNTKLEIAKEIILFTDDVTKIKHSSVNKDKYYYGLRIDNEVGIEIVRDDKLARAVFNADEFRMQKGNGNGNYTDSLYFDAISQTYKFVGKIEASEIEASNFIGGSIAIGSNFTVDNNGNMNANNANFRGNIDGSIISASSYVGGSIAIGSNFTVDNNGNMVANNGKFIGNVDGSTINGSIMNGSTINGANINGGNINVNTNVNIGSKLFINFGGGDNGIYFGATTSAPSLQYEIGGTFGFQGATTLYIGNKRVLTVDDLPLLFQ